MFTMCSGRKIPLNPGKPGQSKIFEKHAVVSKQFSKIIKKSPKDLPKNFGHI